MDMTLLSNCVNEANWVGATFKTMFVIRRPGRPASAWWLQIFWHQIDAGSSALKILTSQHIEAETNGRHFADAIFKCIFFNENVWIPIKISLKFVPKGSIDNIPAMVQIMAWRRRGDKPLSGPMVVCLPTHICVARPQWVKEYHIDTCITLHNIHIASQPFNKDCSREVGMPATSWFLCYCQVHISTVVRYYDIML